MGFDATRGVNGASLFYLPTIEVYQRLPRYTLLLFRVQPSTWYILWMVWVSKCLLVLKP